MYANNRSRQDRPAHRQTVQLCRLGRELQLLGLRERLLKRCDLRFVFLSEQLAWPDDAFRRLVADPDSDVVPDGHLLPSEVSRDEARRGYPDLHP